jgi:spore germination protein KB
MTKNSLSSQQLAIIIFLLLIGSSLVFLTGGAASQNAWLATLGGSFLGLYVLYAIIKIHNLFPGQRITQVSIRVLGKIPGTILNSLFLWSVFAILLTFLFDIIMLMEIIYPLLPRVILYPLLILPCCYCLYKGIHVLGRLGEILVWIMIIVAMAGLLLALPQMDISNIKPVLENWRPFVAGTLYAADWPFNEVVIFALFLPMVVDYQRNRSIYYYWYLLGALLLTLIDVNIITVLGEGLAHLSLFPLFESSRLVGLENFQRVELLFFVIWLFTGMFTMLIYYQGLTLIVQDLFALKSYKPLILPLGLCIVVFTLYMFPNTVEYMLLGFNYLQVFTFPFNLLYPTIILGAAQYRQKHPSQNPPTNLLQRNA